jgi:hypothetical protein
MADSLWNQITSKAGQPTTSKGGAGGANKPDRHEDPDPDISSKVKPIPNASVPAPSPTPIAPGNPNKPPVITEL